MPQSELVRRLVPASIATVETRRDVPGARLFPREERAIRGAVERRRLEFSSGRACARAALLRLGIPPAGIAKGPHGEPVWPAGVVGSITHCAGYRACAVAFKGDVLSVGVDVAVNAPLPDGVLAQLATPDERAWVLARAPSPYADRLLLSIKEAVYKAWYPMAGDRLEPEHVIVGADVSRGRFTARVVGSARGPATVCGRWTARRGLVAAAVVIGPSR